MKKLRYFSLVIFFFAMNQLFGQEYTKDSVQKNFEATVNYSVLTNMNKYLDNGKSFGIVYLWGNKNVNNLITKIGFDMKLQLIGTSKTIDFNRDSLWASNYTTPHISGADNNGVLNFQFGIPLSVGYQFKTRGEKDRLEVGLGVTTYYTLSYLTETYTVNEKETTYNQSKTSDLSFIQQPINFNATSSINYIINNNWIIGANTSYSINSMFKTNYMRFNPLSLGVSLGVNINRKKK